MADMLFLEFDPEYNQVTNREIKDFGHRRRWSGLKLFSFGDIHLQYSMGRIT